MTRRNTRELILKTSLALFNEFGEPNVTTNHISDEADISPGNLYYHFGSKDDISLELFKIFLARLQPLLELDEDDLPTAEEFWLRLHLIFETMGHFRFLYRNLTDLHARIHNLRRAFHGLLARQRATLHKLILGLRQLEIMDITDAESLVLTENMLVVMTYWIPFAEIQSHPGLADGAVLSETVSRTLHLLIPYLREPESSLVTELAESYRP